MARRRRYSKSSRIWPWVSFIVFALILALLGFSIINKQSPAQVLSSLFGSDLPADDLRRLDKNELVELVTQKNLELNQLKKELQKCIEDDGFRKGIISTSSSTLNMRSEPSLESAVLLEIPTGSQVSILYYDDRQLFLDGAMGQWCKIKYADQEGWVWGNYISQ